MAVERRRLGEILIDAGVLTQEQLTKALELQGNDGPRLGSILLGHGFVPEPQLVQALSRQLSIPWVSLWHVDVPDELLELVPFEVARDNWAVPVYVRTERKKGSFLYVAMDDPTNEDAIEMVSAAAGMPVRAMVAGPSDIASALRDFYGRPVGTPDFPSPSESPSPAPRDSEPISPSQGEEEEPRGDVLTLDSAHIVELAEEHSVDESVAEDDDQEEERIAAEDDDQEEERDEDEDDDQEEERDEDEPERAARVLDAPTEEVETSFAERKDEEAEPDSTETGEAGSPWSSRPRRSSSYPPRSDGEDRGRHSSIPPGRRPRAAALTFLDGTTIDLTGHPTPVSDESIASVPELIALLRASGRGEPIPKQLPSARWETYMADLIELLVGKGLLTEEEILKRLLS